MVNKKAKNAYDTKYVAEHHDIITFKLPKGSKDKLKASAEAQGITLTDLLRKSVNKYL